MQHFIMHQINNYKVFIFFIKEHCIEFYSPVQRNLNSRDRVKWIRLKFNMIEQYYQTLRCLTYNLVTLRFQEICQIFFLTVCITFMRPHLTSQRPCTLSLHRKQLHLNSWNLDSRHLDLHVYSKLKRNLVCVFSVLCYRADANILLISLTHQ